MTALAVDAFGKCLRKCRRVRTAGTEALQRSRVGVVAEHAACGNRAAKVLLIFAVVTRAHRPISGLLRVPAYGQLDEFPLRIAMKIGARMVAGADHIVDLLLDNIGFFSMQSSLRALFVEPAIALQHCVVHFRGPVVDGVIFSEALDGGAGINVPERPAHARLAVRFRDLPMASRARAGIDIVGFCLYRCRFPAESAPQKHCSHVYRHSRAENPYHHSSKWTSTRR